MFFANFIQSELVLLPNTVNYSDPQSLINLFYEGAVFARTTSTPSEFAQISMFVQPTKAYQK